MRVFVANRGEVAVRIIKACHDLGFETVLGVSTVDRDSTAARVADRVVVLGGPRAGQSYLLVQAVVHAAVATGCDAVHPGYGFLAENPELADACAKEGITFIGPSADILRRLGDKIAAREVAESLGTPVSPGGRVESRADVAALAAEIGYPVLIKAAFGGGGKGMQLVHDSAGLETAWELAAAEAEAAFGNPTVFLERFVADARHIEVQVIGDTHENRSVVGLRECSIQHRYQKVIEESGVDVVSAEHTTVLEESALAIASHLGYVGLGTVEFLLDAARDELSFLEVNPRLQVEHPVTEAVYGVDLVREQILVCLGERLSWTPDELTARGHAIEFRITAHDPARDLAPGAGTVTRWRPPRRGSIRLDSHVFEGYAFPPYYDALMGKLIVWGADRAQAVILGAQALEEFQIEGIPTTLPMLQRIIAHPDYIANQVTTRWLSELLTRGDV